METRLEVNGGYGASGVTEIDDSTVVGVALGWRSVQPIPAGYTSQSLPAGVCLRLVRLIGGTAF